MEVLLVVLAATFYTSITTVVIVLWIFNHTGKPYWYEIGQLLLVSITWPLWILPLIIIAGIVLIYRLFVRSTSVLRQDLKNRKQLKAFEDWYDRIGKDLYP